MDLTGQNIKQLREAIESAFPKQDLIILLDEDLEIQESDIEKGDNYYGFNNDVLHSVQRNLKILKL